MWVDEVVWEPTVGDFAVPVSWMEGLGLLGAGEDAADAANADSDGDGLTNAQEYMLGTDPNDPHSGFTTGLEWNGGRWKVVWEPDLANGNYRIMGRRALNDDGEWENVTDIPDLEETGFHFFRVEALPPSTPDTP